MPSAQREKGKLWKAGPSFSSTVALCFFPPRLHLGSPTVVLGAASKGRLDESQELWRRRGAALARCSRLCGTEEGRPRRGRGGDAPRRVREGSSACSALSCSMTEAGMACAASIGGTPSVPVGGRGGGGGDTLTSPPGLLSARAAGERREREREREADYD